MGTIKEIEDNLIELNYVGEEASYVGADDPSVSFNGGARSFATEHNSNLKFGYTLKNTTAGKAIVAIAFGDFPTASSVITHTGEAVDCLIADGLILGAGAAAVTAVASNPKLTIAHLLRFVKRNPTAIVNLTLQANSDEAWKEKMTIIRANPFYPAKTEYLDLNDYLDQMAPNSKKIEVPIQRIFPDLQMDDQTIILLPIGGNDVVPGAGVSLTMSFTLGAVNNQAAALPKKRNKAISNIQRLLSRRK